MSKQNPTGRKNNKTDHPDTIYVRWDQEKGMFGSGESFRSIYNRPEDVAVPGKRRLVAVYKLDSIRVVMAEPAVSGDIRKV